MKIEGARTLVTGGGRGIGLELAKALHGLGARIAICGRDPDTLERARGTIGGGSVCISADVADPDAPLELVRHVREAFGGLDILINNAAIQLNYSFFDRPYAELASDIEREVVVDLVAPIRLSAAMLPLLRESQDAAIVNLGSGLGLAPKTSAPVYCATKAALRTFSRALGYQAEAQAPSLKVIDVTLPIVDTDMTKGRGSGKISASDAAAQIVSGMQRDRKEVYVGKAGLFSIIMRMAPSVGYGMLKGS